MTGEHWPTLEEIEAEDRAAGRLDEAKIAEHRARYEALIMLTALAEAILAEESKTPTATKGERGG